MWRRHVHLPGPSHHDIRNTCMQLLPLVEMYCKWELEEDCTSLQALMVRFDSELELESHELGRSLLFMVRDETTTTEILAESRPPLSAANPFDIVRERLAAAGLAIRTLQHQVHYISMPTFSSSTSLPHFNSIQYEFVHKHVNFVWHSKITCSNMEPCLSHLVHVCQSTCHCLQVLLHM